MAHRRRERVGGAGTGEVGERQLGVRGEQDEVAEAAAVPHVGRGDHRAVAERRGGGGDLPADETERAAVGEVDGEHPAGGERAGDERRELDRRQVRGDAGACEHVDDDEVGTPGRQGEGLGAGVADAQVEQGVVGGEPGADEVGERTVELDDGLR